MKNEPAYNTEQSPHARLFRQSISTIHTMARPRTQRPIDHAEALEIAGRLVNSHFNLEPRARTSIPADPNRDDDLLIFAYIQQQQESRSIRNRIESLIREYHYALDTRTNNDIAANECIRKIEAMFGLEWFPGAELRKRDP